MKRVSMFFCMSFIAAAGVANAQTPREQPPTEVYGYPKVLDARRVYRPGQRVRVEAPHGVYTGLLEMNGAHFVWLIKVQLQERGVGKCDDCEKGRVEARVRHATSPTWKALRFSYLCEQRQLHPGQVELARRDFRKGTTVKSDRDLLIGSHNSICVLRGASMLPE